MQFQSLLLSRDPEVVRVLQPALEKLSIEVEVCRGAQSGNEILSAERFDAVIVDCDDLQEGLDVLAGLRKTPSNRTAVAFALLNGHTSTQKAFELGANFVLQKPISTLNANRCFSAAIGTMTKERRRYFRHPVNLAVKIDFGQSDELIAQATNVSEGGIALQFDGAFPTTGILNLIFSLPGSDRSIQTKAQLAWMDGNGRAGARFVDTPKDSREQLDFWLDAQMERIEHTV